MKCRCISVIPLLLLVLPAVPSRQHLNHVAAATALSNTPCRCPSCASTTLQRIPKKHRVNVAFNKEATISSRASRHLPGCGVVDGFHGMFKLPLTCVESADYDREPWWTLDLGGVYTIRTVELTWPKEKEYDQHLQFAAYKLSVDGQICWKAHPKIRHIPSKLHANQKVYDEYKLVECQEGLTGRYLRLSKEGAPERDSLYKLKICEVQVWVCDDGYYVNGSTCVPCKSNCSYRCDNYYGCDAPHEWNVAMKKKARQSSTARGSAANAVDGVLASKTVSQCTATDVNLDGNMTRWWSVDLQSLHAILYVNITSRADCCGRNLTDFDVVVHVSNIIPSPVTEEVRCGAHFMGRPVTGETFRITCRPGIRGRFVSIVKAPPASLQLCEVQVFGYSLIEIRPGDACGQNGTTACAVGSECAIQPNRKMICKNTLGSECTGNTGREQCVHGTACDASGTCRLTLNQNCTLHPDKCMSGTVCDRKAHNTCKALLGELCEQTEDCGEDLVCDQLGKCRIGVNHTCAKAFESGCVVGAACDKRTRRCACKSSTIRNGSFCVGSPGLVGSSCEQPSRPCKDKGNTCVNGKCACGREFQMDANFTCRKGIGFYCDTADQCSTGACYKGRFCWARNGESCRTSGYCSDDSTCTSDYVCRIKPGKNCWLQPTRCVRGSRCLEGFCRQWLGGACKQVIDCPGGIDCSIKGGRYICSLRNGQSCFGNNRTACPRSSECSADGVCKIKLGHPCTVSLKDPHCQRFAECDAKLGCKLMLGAVCESDGDCKPNTVCDNKKLCKIPKYGDCKKHPNMCLAGAVCRAGNCTCIDGITQTNTKKCDPVSKKVDGTCRTPNIAASSAVQLSKSVCLDPFAVCVQGRCQCSSNYVALNNYTCGVGVGAVCSKSYSHCVEGTICDISGVCLLDVGQSCAGTRRSLCKFGTVCDDDDVCKLQLHRECGSSPEHSCAYGTVCDTFGRCKIAHGGFCWEDKVCVAGSTCQSVGSNGTRCTCDSRVSLRIGSICGPLKGRIRGRCSKNSDCSDSNARCSSSTSKCECQPGFAEETTDFSCKLAVGKNCTGKETSCKSGTTCDSVVNECRVELGEVCDARRSNSCVTGAICGSFGFCKLDLNENCNGSSTEHCKTGAFCDYLGKCKTGAGLECNSTSSECVAGGSCIESACVCMKDVTTLIGYLCVPVPGRIHAFCDDHVPCTVANSACVDEMCVCTEGHQPTHDLACTPGSIKRTNNAFIGTILGTLVVLAAVIAVLTFVLYQQRKRPQTKTAKSGSIAKLRKGSLSRSYKQDAGKPTLNDKDGFSDASHEYSEASSSSRAPDDLTSDAHSETTSEAHSQFTSDAHSQLTSNAHSQFTSDDHSQFTSDDHSQLNSDAHSELTSDAYS